jgi:hypothetical protein
MSSPPLFAYSTNTHTCSVSFQRQTCGELPVPIEKGKHKFIRGPRGANVDQVFLTTGVHVDIPAQDSDSTTITLRGETTRLAEALQKVYELVCQAVNDVPTHCNHVNVLSSCNTSSHLLSHSHGHRPTR